RLCDFITSSPTPFHAVSNICKRLVSSGFTPIFDRSPSSLSPGGKYFYTRNQSSIVAFTLPSQPSSDTYISFAVGHLDSPCLKLRPISKKSKLGYLQVGVELYGGGTWPTWFDRDLSLAGRVILSTPGLEKPYTSRLVKINRPLLRIPHLPIHLDRTLGDSFKFNKEAELAPILGLVNNQLNSTEGLWGSTMGSGLEVEKEENDVSGMMGKHHPLLLAALADELECEIGDIQDFELSLFDTQPSCVGGLSNEFIFSPRLDNLTTCYSTIEALCAVSETTATTSCENIRCVILFDNEEVGSISNHGAESNLLPGFVDKICSLPDYRDRGAYNLLTGSFLISADMGHAINPNYENKYETNHAPRLNGGVVIKTNANQKYTSNAQTTFLLRRIAKAANVPLQEFEIRNDSTCGSTVGPHLSTHVRTVDIGLAQLAMHSIRETAGSGDIKHYISLFLEYFTNFTKYDRELKVD
ncbi:hypothetical protein TREMEDRAFT_34565, partial [Tremella mesenterica DSM 1558]|uniref:uncharacterized protein n=1 Tax=Tremella mesenterica (strain ATCC 24925 / CBS 8224 / DSM 1558 / NBRC 9311 / NRRL Y-6157 / RJB 2259-6 / UBC 559-6) TaxID=578456 RepID=UPI00032BE016